MFSCRKYKHLTCFAASAAVTAGLLMNTPSVAYADAAADLASARTNLEQIGQKVEDLSGDLETLVTELDNTEYEIVVKEQKIAQNQEILASFVSRPRRLTSRSARRTSSRRSTIPRPNSMSSTPRGAPRLAWSTPSTLR